MLTKEEIQVLVVLRIFAALDSCNSYHANHVHGQIKALVAVLNGGEPIESEKAVDYLDAAGIPTKPHPESKDGFVIPSDWLVERGCIIEGTRISHPNFKRW